MGAIQIRLRREIFRSVVGLYSVVFLSLGLISVVLYVNQCFGQNVYEKSILRSQ